MFHRLTVCCSPIVNARAFFDLCVRVDVICFNLRKYIVTETLLVLELQPFAKQ